MSDDKKTIGLTDVNKRIMDQVVEKMSFKREMDAAKFAFAFTVSTGVSPAEVDGAGTIWNVGSFDEDGEIKVLIQNLFPSSVTPYRTLESLINTGFSLLAVELEANPNVTVKELLDRNSASAK